MSPREALPILSVTDPLAASVSSKQITVERHFPVSLANPHLSSYSVYGQRDCSPGAITNPLKSEGQVGHQLKAPEGYRVSVKVGIKIMKIKDTLKLN